MVRLLHRMAIVVALFACSLPVTAQSADINHHLRDQYQGKTFLLRGFYSSDRLRYDSSGVPGNATAGDWTVDGFIQVRDIHLSDDKLIIKAQRMVAARVETKQLTLLSRKKDSVHLEIKADPGMHNPAPEQVDALLSKIFLTSQDSLANLVPDYWKPCVNEGLKGEDKKCAFAPEFLAIPGVAISSVEDNSSTTKTSGESHDPVYRMVGSFHKDIRPPRVTYQREPEFSESARAAKFQGVVILMLVVNKDGTPTKVRIAQPVGYGLDEKAVEAVESWKFTPGEKDGLPVNIEIAVEVSFHLY